MIKRTHIAILGAGSWGTAVAVHLAAFGHRVLLWGRDIKQIEDMRKKRENLRYLPSIVFPDNLAVTGNIEDCFEAEHLIVATPSHTFRELLHQLPKTLKGLSWITKGIDPQSHQFLSQLVFDYFYPDFPIAIISGPSFAKEVACHLPTAVVIASNHMDYAQIVRDIFHKTTIRGYLSHDIIGVQLCGAMKNVMAIACGISDGLSYGANAKAALITRGLSEMTRLGLAFDADPSTFSGLAGVGDLVLTCTDNQSRNRRFGLLLGQGVSILEAESQIGQVVEGKYNSAQIHALATAQKIELPICTQVHLILQGHHSASEGAIQLMTRPLV
jgi:glycerol-3-phosphate dehydrogenase (NAD(P)+)